MSDDTSQLDALAEEFTARLRAGEAPDPEEYARRHPPAAERIRRLCSTLLVLEGAGGGRPSPPPAPAGLSPGAVFGGYRIERLIARGGMGIVYRASHLQLGKTVALKVLAGAAGLDGERLERFLREARTAASLHHPHIVTVFDVGQVDGIPYYAMEHIDGRGLDAALRDAVEGPAMERFRWAAEIALQAAQALEHAHAQGVIHRDIKPSNLLLDRQGKVWITDFGLARSASDPALTQSGVLLGTPRYMSPEQVDPERGEADHRSDIYGLGATLYELLARRPAFDGRTSREVLLQIAESDAPTPRRVEPSVPRDLETIVRKAMARLPADRYPSASAMADDLRRWLRREPIHARRASPAERAWRWSRREPALASLLACVGILLVAVTIISTRSALVLRGERNAARRTLRDSYVDQARAKRVSGLPERRFESLEAVARAASMREELSSSAGELLELRNEAIAALALADLRVAWERPETRRGTFALGFDADLARFAIDAGEGEVSIRGAGDDRELIRLKGPAGRPRAVRFSPDGRHLSVHRRGEDGSHWEVWDLVAAGRKFTLPAARNGNSTDFDAGGRRWAAALAEGSIAVHDLADGTEWRMLPAPRSPGPMSPGSLRFHPHAARLAEAAEESTEVRIWDLEAAAVLRRLRNTGLASSLAWSPAGDLLAVGTNASGIYLWEAETGFLRARLPGSEGRGQALELAFSRRGDLLASSAWDDHTTLWDLATERSLVTIPGRVHRFGPDDRRLAFFRPQAALGLWEVAPGREHRIVHGSPETGRLTWSADFSPGGRWLAVACESGLLFLETATVRELAFLPLGKLYTVLFAPDGRSLITCGDAGLFRWPVMEDAAADGVAARLGQPERLLEGSLGRAAISADGRLLAAVDRRNARVIAVERGAGNGDAPLRTECGPHPGVHYAALSPDGRWIATGTYLESGVKVWELPEGRLAADLPVPSSATVAFSPDGRRLVVCPGGSYRLIETGTWRPVREVDRAAPDVVPGPMAFSADGALLAVAHTRNRVRLLDASSGAELAMLEEPGEEEIKWIAFSRGGRWLAAGWRTMRLWDLGSVRRELREMALDWEPPGRITDEESGDGAPVRLAADAGDFLRLQAAALEREVEAQPRSAAAHERLARARRNLGDWSGAIAAYEALLQNVPRPSHRPLVDLAWMLLTGPEEHRDPRRAEELARRAVKAAPRLEAPWRALGLACLRNDKLPEALEALQAAVALDPRGEGPVHAFALAIVYQRMGRKDLAASLRRRGEEPDPDRPGLSRDELRDLQVLRDEAQALLEPAEPR